MKKRLVISLTVGLIFLLLAYLQPYKLVVIVGRSMMPTFYNRQIVVAKKTTEFKKNDIVVCYSDDRSLIVKRIAYGPEEYYYYIYRKDGTMELIQDNSYRSILDNKEIDEGFMVELKIPKNHYYLLGDNLNESDDSRRFGTIDKKDILYKVIQ